MRTNKKVRTVPEKRKRKLVAVDVQNVRNLAETIGKLIPLSGYRSSFTITKLAKDRALSKYLMVQQISGFSEIGADLMGKAFNEKGGKIQLNNL